MRQTSFPEAGISSSQLAHGPPRFGAFVLKHLLVECFEQNNPKPKF